VNATCRAGVTPVAGRRSVEGSEYLAEIRGRRLVAGGELVVEAPEFAHGRSSVPWRNRPAPTYTGRRAARRLHRPTTGGVTMSVVKIIELVGNSTTSSDDAVQQALAEARQTLRNIKAVDVVSVGLRGDDLDEWRAHVRVAFLIDRVQE
jgi:flavin-binding protein dodecin